MRNDSKPLEFMVVVDSWTFEQVEATLSGNRDNRPKSRGDNIS